MIALAGTVVLAVCAALGAWLDVTTRRLPNWLCLVTACGGLGFMAAESGAITAGLALAHSTVGLIAGMILFRFGMIGGGDAKFYTASAAWFPITSGLTLLSAVSLAGLVIVGGWFGYRQFSGARARDAGGKFAMVPYGAAIAAGAVAARLVLQ